MANRRVLGYWSLLLLEQASKKAVVGIELSRETGLHHTEVYNSLKMMERRGYLETQREHEPKFARPMRVFYKITPLGSSVLAETLEKYGTLIERSKKAKNKA